MEAFNFLGYGLALGVAVLTAVHVGLFAIVLLAHQLAQWRRRPNQRGVGG